MIALTTTLTILIVWMSWGVFSIYTTPRPTYVLIDSLDSRTEIRVYDEQTWISTEQPGDRGAFMVLASYIFGGNAESEKIAMTAPVVTDSRMSFILPADMSIEDAPKPDGQDIVFEAIPRRRVAALSFSWWASTKRVESKTAALLSLLEDKGIEVTGNPFLMRYNDPWTPPFLRRNEVAIQVVTGARASDNVRLDEMTD
jgi:hypothetical protein